MKLAVFTTVLLASIAFAAPLTAKRQARHEARQLARAERRAAGTRRTNRPLNPSNGEAIKLNASRNVDYSENWAGAVLIGTGYTAVTGEFTVPTPSVPSGGSSDNQYCASAWVGIDGDTCDTAIIQTGVDFCIQDGSVSYDAWYEWYPDNAYDFSGITISAGDVIKVTVDATSDSAGTATLEDVTSGTTVSYNFSNEQDDLCEYNAEWIVEDFEENGSLVDFADFGTVTFSSASATDGSSTVGPEDATILDIEQDTEVLTSVSVSSSEVIITYE